MHCYLLIWIRFGIFLGGGSNYLKCPLPPAFGAFAGGQRHTVQAFGCESCQRKQGTEEMTETETGPGWAGCNHGSVRARFGLRVAVINLG